MRIKSSFITARVTHHRLGTLLVILIYSIPYSREDRRNISHIITNQSVGSLFWEVLHICKVQDAVAVSYLGMLEYTQRRAGNCTLNFMHVYININTHTWIHTETYNVYVYIFILKKWYYLGTVVLYKLNEIRWQVIKFLNFIPCVVPFKWWKKSLHICYLNKYDNYSTHLFSFLLSYSFIKTK